MKITNVTVHVFEQPGAKDSILEITQVPTLKRMQFTHTRKPIDKPVYIYVMRVATDEGIEGLCMTRASVGPISSLVELLRANVIGEDPLNREYLFQKLQLGTRWVYQKPGWFGSFDNCLWDIAGKIAGLPVCKLIGKVRDGVPVYQTAGDGPLELYIEHIEQGKELGINGYKPHSYKGGKADIPIMEGLRKHVGPDFDLMLDPVCSYTLREAIEVGHVLEELDFVWLEEPFHEQKMNLYQELCSTLTIPVMGTEMFEHDMNICAQWLIHGATDLIRATARFGTTQVLKVAHFAELHGTSIELHAMGGLFRHIHAQLGCAIANNDYFEEMPGRREGTKAAAARMGMMNLPQIVDGKLIPADGPGWGVEWDMEQFEKSTVEII